MSQDRRYHQQQQDDEYYNQRSSSHRQSGYYPDQQGNPYAYYGEQQQQQPDYGYGYQNGYGHEQQVARGSDRDRYYRSDDEDDVSLLCLSNIALRQHHCLRRREATQTLARSLKTNPSFAIRPRIEI